MRFQIKKTFKLPLLSIPIAAGMLYDLVRVDTQVSGVDTQRC